MGVALLRPLGRTGMLEKVPNISLDIAYPMQKESCENY